MKFVHTADWHIGASSRFIPEHLSRQEQMIDNIYEIADKHNIDLVLVCGDIFQKNEPNSKERDLLLRKVLEYDKYIYSIIMEGNHDAISVEASAIHFLKLLEDKKKFKRTRIVEIDPALIQFDNDYVISLPTFKKKLLKRIVKSIPKKRNSIVVMGHQATIGAELDSGFKLKTGTNISEFKQLDITYYAMGDIHKKQKLEIQNAFQCGAPIQHKFDEQLPKGVLIVDTENPKNPKFIKVKKNIKPLIVMNEGDIIPKKAYVKLLLNKETFHETFPTNVVATGSINEQSVIKRYRNKEQKITTGLKPFLKDKGLVKKEIRKCFTIVRKIAKEKRINNYEI